MKNTLMPGKVEHIQNEFMVEGRECYARLSTKDKFLVEKEDVPINFTSFLWRLHNLLKRLKVNYLLSVLLFSIGTEMEAQSFVDHEDIPNHSYVQVCFLNGYKTYFGAINKLSIADIHEAEVRVSYSYPSGALMVRTNHFVNDLRPEFYRNLQKWLRSWPKKNFIIDGKPLKNRKALLVITEQDIEGFSFLSIGGKEAIEIILVPDFGINYR